MTDDGIIDHIAIRRVIDGHATWRTLTRSEKREAIRLAETCRWWEYREVQR